MVIEVICGSWAALWYLGCPVVVRVSVVFGVLSSNQDIYGSWGSLWQLGYSVVSEVLCGKRHALW